MDINLLNVHRCSLLHACVTMGILLLSGLYRNSQIRSKHTIIIKAVSAHTLIADTLLVNNIGLHNYMGMYNNIYHKHATKHYISATNYVT